MARLGKKIGKAISTGIFAAAAAAGAYYVIKNKDELTQRAKEFAEKIKNNYEDPNIDLEIEFEDECACDEPAEEAVEETVDEVVDEALGEE